MVALACEVRDICHWRAGISWALVTLISRTAYTLLTQLTKGYLAGDATCVQGIWNSDLEIIKFTHAVLVDFRDLYRWSNSQRSQFFTVGSKINVFTFIISEKICRQPTIVSNSKACWYKDMWFSPGTQAPIGVRKLGVQPEATCDHTLEPASLQKENQGLVLHLSSGGNEKSDRGPHWVI